MTTKNAHIVSTQVTNATIEDFANLLALAFGGHSNVPLEAVGQAVRGQVSNGGWWCWWGGIEDSEDVRAERLCGDYAEWYRNRWIFSGMSEEEEAAVLPTLRRAAKLA